MINPQEYVANLVKQALNELNIKTKIDIGQSVMATDPKFGDFASNIALQLANQEKLIPLELAQKIVDHLKQDKNVMQVDVAGAGFINITLAVKYWIKFANQLSASLSSNEGKGKKVSIEFVSANPTGPLVLVNAWQAYYGDILARVFTNCGFQTEREYYFNDTGTQILQLGRSIQSRLGQKFEKEIEEQLYKGDYVDDLAEQIRTQMGDKERVIEADPYDIGRSATKLLFDVIKAGLLRMGVDYDQFFSDEQVDTDKALELLEAKKAVINKDNAVWLKKEVLGTDQDRVLIRSAGRGPTYFFNDIAYQLNRLSERKFDIAITIVGPDHHAEAQYLSSALKLLGYDNFISLSTQTVRLIKDGKEVKMSKRAGTFILLDDFLNLVPSDVARFYFGSRDINSHFDFDLDEAKAQNKQNQLFYCMYAYARSGSILQKASDEAKPIGAEVNHQLSSVELNIIRQANSLSETIKSVPQTFKVHAIFHELIKFSKLFHDYYEKDRILALTDRSLQASKLAFVKVIHEYLKNIFELIGITPQDKM